MEVSYRYQHKPNICCCSRKPFRRSGASTTQGSGRLHKRDTRRSRYIYIFCISSSCQERSNGDLAGNSKCFQDAAHTWPSNHRWPGPSAFPHDLVFRIHRRSSIEVESLEDVRVLLRCLSFSDIFRGRDGKRTVEWKSKFQCHCIYGDRICNQHEYPVFKPKPNSFRASQNWPEAPQVDPGAYFIFGEEIHVEPKA